MRREPLLSNNREIHLLDVHPNPQASARSFADFWVFARAALGKLWRSNLGGELTGLEQLELRAA